MIEEERQPITADQVGCARCGGEGHPGITYQPFTLPVEMGGVVATHWAPCPTNGEPILYAVVPVAVPDPKLAEIFKMIVAWRVSGAEGDADPDTLYLVESIEETVRG